MAGIASAIGIITFAVQEAPEIGQVIANLVNGGSKTVDPVAVEAALETSDEDLQAAYQRAFPGQAFPTSEA